MSNYSKVYKNVSAELKSLKYWGNLQRKMTREERIEWIQDRLSDIPAREVEHVINTFEAFVEAEDEIFTEGNWMTDPKLGARLLKNFRSAVSDAKKTKKKRGKK